MTNKSKAQQLVEEARKKNAEASSTPTPTPAPAPEKDDMADLDALLGDINSNGPVTPEGNQTPEPAAEAEKPKLFETTIEDAPPPIPTPDAEIESTRTHTLGVPQSITNSTTNTVKPLSEPSARFKSRTEAELEAGRRALEKKRPIK